jgi:myo-inositol 2-dehydrogenase / D-chiro-inositol 1-dehydrogenase
MALLKERTMTTLAELQRAVASTLGSKRLGQPVFVRLHLQNVLEEEGYLPAALGRVAAVVGDWIGQAPARVYTLPFSRIDKGQCSLLLQFPNGASALVSESQGTAAPPGVDLTVIGSKGALYHAYEGGGAHAWEELAGSLPEGRGAEIREAIETAYRDGPKPEVIAQPQPRKPEPIGPPSEVKAKYGVLLVSGSHTHQENYAAAFAADGRCKLIALTDEPDVDPRRRALNQRLADALGIPYIADLAKGLERKDVHVASICAPPERRCRIALRCAQAGKHLYLDKPLVPKLAEADALAAAVLKAGVRSHMFSFLTAPWARAAKEFFASGSLGKLLAIHADSFFAKGYAGTATLGTPRKEEFPPERHQLVEAKRELDNIGVYPVTLARWLTGKKFRSVYGVTANYFFKESQKNNVEDFGVIAATLEDGTPVTIAAGRIGWASHPAGGANRMILVGTERTLVIDANRPRLEVSTDEKPWVPPNVNPADPLAFWQSTQEEMHLMPKRAWVPLSTAGPSDASSFLDCLDANRESELSVAEAALAVEVILAAYKSAASGEVVSLPLPR